MKGSIGSFHHALSQWYPLADKLAGRLGKACGRNPDVYAAEKSDTGVIPKKEPNKIGWPMAEALEERPVTKGNSEETAANCTQGQGEAFWPGGARRHHA